MTFETVIGLITEKGFPIVACCAIAWFCWKLIQQYRADIKEMAKEHHEEMAEMKKAHSEDMQAVTAAIDNNTSVMRTVLDHFSGKEKST